MSPARRLAKAAPPPRLRMTAPDHQVIGRAVLADCGRCRLVRLDLVTTGVPRRLEHRYLWETAPCK